MERKPTFKASDLKRAIKVFKDEGLPIGGATITVDGTITILTSAEVAKPDPLEEWERKHGKR